MENEDKQPQEAETPDTAPEKEQETDWKAEALKYKAIADRREKKLTELKTTLDEKKPEAETKKSNTEGLTREEAIFFAKGFEEDDFKIASSIAKVNGISLMEATKDEYFQAVIEKRKQKEEDKKASLPPSNAAGFNSNKSIKEMTRDEHMKLVAEQMNKVVNG